jgi:hypothetical protein
LKILSQYYPSAEIISVAKLESGFPSSKEGMEPKKPHEANKKK